ncbi:hypothetical protein [Spiractinospora alimapuensis]|uniref:hypothetical protein n=1 Tax=Spiractinospora alimapuensis TaxID=2820884 RepID=UPI001F227B4E|nr:hypothetical protein [Spiractinospora alimapuensis]
MSDDAAVRISVSDLDTWEVWALQSGEHATAAEHLAFLAEQVGPASEVPRVELLVRSGEQWELAEEHERALATYRTAAADGREAILDPRALQIGPLFHLGHTHEARRLLTVLDAEGPRNLPTHIAVVESLYAHGHLAMARDWGTTGYTRFQSQNVSPFIHNLLQSLLRTRYRVGVDLGLPEDDLDRLITDT